MVVGPVRKKIAAAADQANATAAAYKDGVAIEIELDLGLLATQIRQALAGKLKGKIKLPARVLVDPSYVTPRK